MLYTQFDIYTHKIQKLGVTLLFLQIIKKSNMEDFYGHWAFFVKHIKINLSVKFQVNTA